MSNKTPPPDPIINGLNLGLRELGCKTELFRIDKHDYICKGGKTTHEEIHVYFGKRWVYALKIVNEGCHVTPGYYMDKDFCFNHSQAFVVPIDHPESFNHLKQVLLKHAAGAEARAEARRTAKLLLAGRAETRS
jgi:hypothetical protein